tara:strand:+ start:279 stop:815 length:537 start_codon:yes stop_codon:yes gene_type:complete
MSAKTADLKRGDFLTLFNYYTFDHMDEEGFAHVTDEKGNIIRIHGKIVEKSMDSTSQHVNEVKVTRTRLAQIMEGLGHAAFRVTFEKQVDPSAVADGLEDCDVSNKAKRRKLVAKLMKGETRVMHAKLLRSKEDDVQMELGRYKVIDLEAQAAGKFCLRLVDTRTVSELVVEGTRYHV